MQDITVTSISLKITPSKTRHNAFTGLLHTISLYLWLWVNCVVLIRAARRGAMLLTDENTVIVGIDATIKPVVKKALQPAPVAEVLP